MPAFSQSSQNVSPLARRRFLMAAGGLALGSALMRPYPAASQAKSLGGQPFSPPDALTPMPPSWMERPIARPQGVDLMLALDQQIFPALVPFAMKWGQEKGLKLAAQEGTCGLASAALGEKSADITGMCCPPGVVDRLPGVSYHTIGISPVAIIVHPSNPLNDISWEQARALFTGAVQSWSDLPMSGIATKHEVRAITRLHCKPRPGHWKLLIGNPDDFARQALDVTAVKDMIIEVSQTKDAVGWETLYHIADNAQRGQVKILKLNGIHPSDLRATAEGRYPFYRVMGITSWAAGPAVNPKAQDLVATLVASAPAIDPYYGILSAQELRKNGWKFKNDELVGEIG